MQQPRDLEVAHQVAGWTPAESRVLGLPLAPRAMLNAIGRCDFLLAMRLHALIFAVHRGVSALGISYDPKVRDFAREAALPEPLDWDTVTPATLGEALRTAWTARHTARLEVRRQAEALRLRARRNIAVMRDALAAPRG
jgi:polysaccharide pyruvyl transferase WcaK-like protein